MLRRVAFIGILGLALPQLAFAQDEDEESAAEETAAEEAAAEEKRMAPPAATAESKGEPFIIRRGFFAETDLGVFFTLGGRNTNNPELPTRGISNVQPYLGLVLGYDIVPGDKFNLGLGLKLAAGYSSGAGRVSGGDISGGVYSPDELTTRPNDFAVMQAGLALSASIFVSSRVAVTVKADGGLAVVDPDTSKIATEEGAASAAMGAMFGGGLGVEYFTLLNDFSVGIDLRFAAVMNGGMIPAISATVPVRYTF